MSRGSYSRQARRTVEASYSLDVRELARRGALKPGAWTVLRWCFDLSDASSAGLLADEDAVLLLYGRDDGQVVKERIELDRTTCTLGGARPWFLCPLCDRRCVLLYLTSSETCCRICANLTYTTSQSSEWGRRVEKARRIGERLGVTDNGFARVKPKGMHWSTFERLTRQYQECSRAVHSSFSEMIEQMRAEMAELDDRDQSAPE